MFICLQTAIQKYIETSFERLPTTMHSLKVLMTFEKLNLKHLDIGAKYQILLQKLGNDIEHIRKVYSSIGFDQLLDLLMYIFGIASFLKFAFLVAPAAEQSDLSSL